MDGAEVETSEWRPGASSGASWTAVAIAVVVVGLFVFGTPVAMRTGRLVLEINVAGIGLVVVVTALLVVVHEGIHAAVMSLFGARPRFGGTLVGGALPAAYTTAPGHRFTRSQYLAVALAPGIAISVAGFAACFTGVGPALVVPLAMHLGGCVGDAAATWHVLRQPSETMFEDLRDGIRFHRPRKSAS